MENRKELIIAGVGTLVAIVSLILFLRRGQSSGTAGTVVSSPSGVGDYGAGGGFSPPAFDPTAGGILGNSVAQPSDQAPANQTPAGPGNNVVPDSTPVQAPYAPEFADPTMAAQIAALQASGVNRITSPLTYDPTTAPSSAAYDPNTGITYGSPALGDASALPPRLGGVTRGDLPSDASTAVYVPDTYNPGAPASFQPVSATEGNTFTGSTVTGQHPGTAAPPATENAYQATAGAPYVETYQAPAETVPANTFTGSTVTGSHTGTGEAPARSSGGSAAPADSVTNNPTPPASNFSVSLPASTDAPYVPITVRSPDQGQTFPPIAVPHNPSNRGVPAAGGSAAGSRGVGGGVSPAGGPAF